MLTHQMGISQAEGRMIAAQLDEALVVLIHLRILLQAVPVEVVDGVGRLKRVVHALLVAQHLLAAEHERHALRGENSSLSQQVEANQLVFLFCAESTELALGTLQTGYAGHQPVDEAHVVVAAHVGNHLCRLVGPRCLRVVHLAHVYLWMTDTAGNAELDVLFLAGNASQERALGVVAERAAQSVAHLIAEGGNAGHLRDIGLHAQLFLRIGTAAGAPPLAIDKEVGVDLVEFGAHGIHRLDVVAAHQVEAESVDTVFVGPVFHRLDDELSHHGLFRGRLVAAARAVAVFPIGRLAEIIVGISLLEVAALDAIGVVVHHVENDADACLM